MIEHSVFALPFAYISALTAMHWSRAQCAGNTLSGPVECFPTGQVDWWVLVLITVAMVAARTFAMAANRIIDREIDARNPRTASRELVTGAMSVRTAAAGAGVSLLVLAAAAAALNPLVLALSPIALAALVVYPYAKRFTWLPHGFLALAQALAPIGAWLAVTGIPPWDAPPGLESVHWSAFVLGLAVGLWIGGFDLIYATQDVESDRAHGVQSFPARWGVAAALRASTLTHVVTVALFAWFGVLAGFGVWWWLGLAVVTAALVYEHAIVKPQDLSRVNRAFFTANGFVGIALFLFALADLVDRGLRFF